MAYLDKLIKKSKEKVKEAPAEEKEETPEDVFKELEQENKEVEAPAPKSVEPEKKEESKTKETDEEVGEITEEEKNLTLLDTYGNVKIYQVENSPLLHYSIPLPKLRGAEKALIDALREIASQVITIDPTKIKDPERRRNMFFEKIMEIIDSTPELNIPPNKKEFYASAVVREMIGYGILDEFIKDPQLEEVMVIGPNKPVYVFHRKYEMMTTNAVFYDDVKIRDIIDKIARYVGRRIDIQNPLLDARMPDGSRVNATTPPASIDGSTITLRKFREDPLTIVSMLKYNTLNSEAAAFLWLAVEGLGAKPANILISGGTASGKTSTLNVLANFIPPDERILTIEDTAELRLPIEHWIRMESRPPSIEGTGEITLDLLMKNALRMRPDRIIVGEIRHSEAFTLFTALNTGHEGMGTVHANSAEETIVRLTSPPMSVPSIMMGALNIIIVQQRINDRRKGTIRRITNISEVTGVMDGKPQLESLYEWDAASDDLKETGIKSTFVSTLSKFTGMSKQELDKEINERKKILESLVSDDIVEMSKVSPVLEEYIMKKRK